MASDGEILSNLFIIGRESYQRGWRILPKGLLEFFDKSLVKFMSFPFNKHESKWSGNCAFSVPLEKLINWPLCSALIIFLFFFLIFIFSSANSQLRTLKKKSLKVFYNQEGWRKKTIQWEGSEPEEAKTNETYAKMSVSESHSQGQGRDSRNGKGDRQVKGSTSGNIQLTNKPPGMFGEQRWFRCGPVYG